MLPARWPSLACAKSPRANGLPPRVIAKVSCTAPSLEVVLVTSTREPSPVSADATSTTVPASLRDAHVEEPARGPGFGDSLLHAGVAAPPSASAHNSVETPV